MYEYHNFYKYFIQYFDENASCSIVNKLSSEEWLQKIKDLPFQKNTINTLGKQLIHFIGFLFEYNYAPFFKINQQARTKPEIKEKIVFTENDIKVIFEGLESKNINFKTLIYLAFYTGLRSSDLINIKAEKIDIKQMTLSFYSPKGKKFREIPLHTDLMDVLRERLKEVPEGNIITYNSTENLGKAVQRYLRNICLSQKGYSARTFRKTFITLARSYGIDDSVVRELVGHSQRSTADRFYNKIQMDTMKQSLKKFKRPGTA
ncbi:MAG TPA: site-specific integrase [Ignavibacteriaceae bacterium]|nr:site-specific integrase [Ignavibacteriaceae bacterium]